MIHRSRLQPLWGLAMPLSGSGHCHALVLCQHCRGVGTQRAWSFGRGCLSWLGRKDASLSACGGTGTVPLTEGCTSICTFTVHCILATRGPLGVFGCKKTW